MYMAELSSLAFYAFPVMTIAAAVACFPALLRRFRRGDISRNQAARRYGFTVVFPILAMVALWAIVVWGKYQATGIFSPGSQAALVSIQALFPAAAYFYPWIPILALNIAFWIATSEDEPSPPTR